MSSLFLTRSAISKMVSEANSKFPLETGGILLGRRYVDGSRSIEKVIGPGPKAVHSFSGFVRDGEYSQIKTDEWWDASQGHMNYIGEWHTHPLDCGPSDIDKRTLFDIVEDQKLDCRDAVMIILVNTANGWQSRAFEIVNGEFIETATDQ